ncbi:MAG: LacI family DNA-binding transcriptional regulator [Capsulimonadaceae bacterium]|nr:LacI family DNA-binding transcriptional regulator [Capsulimonadaceae bacterium]
MSRKQSRVSLKIMPETQTSLGQVNAAIPVKHRAIRDALQEAIRTGEFLPGAQLPSERDLALRFGVSYPTVRQAVSDMVRSRLLERRGRQGTFVRLQSQDRLNAATINLICGGEDYPLSSDFRRIAKRLLDHTGRKSNVIWLRPGGEDEIVRMLDNGELAILLHDFSFDAESLYGEGNAPLVQAMRRAQGRAVVIANVLDHLGIPSVVADDAQTMRLAVSHLQQSGHRRIALICDRPEHPVARIQVAAWRSSTAPMDTDRLLIAVRTPDHECMDLRTYHKTREFLKSEESRGVTSMISSPDPAAVFAACRDEGRPVPEAMSVIAIGNTPSMLFTHPPTTSIDVDVEQHVRYALDFLSAGTETRAREDYLRLVEPRLIERQSVKQI